jgi:transposase
VEPTSNGYAEGVINKVKVIKRRAYGLPSFESFRHRVPRSMRLTGSSVADPARSARTHFSTDESGSVFSR